MNRKFAPKFEISRHFFGDGYTVYADYGTGGKMTFEANNRKHALKIKRRLSHLARKILTR